jgi:integrase
VVVLRGYQRDQQLAAARLVQKAGTMPLAMARPWKHPNSGVYWLRKGVPEDLRELVGKREEKRSLQTRDPAEAKRRHSELLAGLEARWANLRAGPTTISEREAHELAAPFFDEWLNEHRDNPSKQVTWNVELGDQVFAPRGHRPGETFDPGRYTEIRPNHFQVIEMETWCLLAAKDRLETLGRRTDNESQRVVAKAVAAALQRASLMLGRLARGEVLPLLAGSSSSAAIQTSAAKPPLSFDDLVKGWAAERRPVAKTFYEWSRVVQQLRVYLGHDDAHRLTGEDFVRWKKSMVDAGLRAKTIQDAKLAPVRAILQWGVQNRLLNTNAAEGVSIDVKSKQSEKKRSFTDEEARTILQAAMREKDPVRRWVPWIGAYTGARVSEICQLRQEDVVELDGIWCLKFAPEAGSLKTGGSERVIPLHPALIDNGFLKFVKSVKPGPIFRDLSPDKFGKRGGNGTKMLGRFVRQLGITDPRLSPSHSWRHRIKTSGRKYGLAQDILDAITGHGSRSVADAYGEFPIEALHRELCKIPRIRL